MRVCIRYKRNRHSDPELYRHVSKNFSEYTKSNTIGHYGNVFIKTIYVSHLLYHIDIVPLRTFCVYIDIITV